ncbi:hypothetical protein F3Y22_tig00000340pilonHSYRG00391 [Hibiscus syriacus]|uniref:Translocation and assembly module TamB C-terminal domain-containing protein n=1 Tax=Hibiscus syriacus TaxID=106335 RepID=A0A6A3D1U9_HIBSY|nr:hypothetical protein F3Y22_tig00000340pilonHSYRG00391 [Hibiscus syriacus]
MSLKLRSPFLGTPLGSSLNGKISNRHCFGFNRWKLHKRAIRKTVFAENQNDWIAQAIRFSHFCGKNIELFRKTIGLRNGFVAKSVKEPFAGSRALVRSLSPLWNEGLLLVRCSVFAAVLSSVGLLVWYGQKKAKAFVEEKLLPSVCSVLSEHIQREVDFGRVRSVSPLSITLEACSIGPHSEEFSCGEVPSMKIHVRPFASLRRGKIVIDAVLFHPNLLIAQKKDYTWLGLPFSSDVLQRHLSTEEGIDYRTKSRRIAREESAACWVRERDDDARKAAEMGYIVSEGISVRSEDNTAKEIELEKSFGVKIPGSKLTLWPEVIKGPKGKKIKKKLNGRDTSCSSVAAKRRILERSASAAIAYFHNLSLEESCDHSKTSRSYDLSYLNTHLLKNEDDSISETSIDISSGEGSLHTYSLYGEQCEEAENRHINGNATLGDFNFLRDPFLMTVERLSGVGNIGENSAYDGNTAGDAKERNSKVDAESLLNIKFGLAPKLEDVVTKLVDGVDVVQTEILVSEDGGWLSTDVFVDNLDKIWHANLNISNLFVPLFERILEIPITWLKGRASGEVHLCMSRGDTFPNLHGQVDRIFLHNTSGWFGNVPLEASGDFGIHPKEGEFHLMCQVPCVEVNALMKTFKMKPLLFPLAGFVTAVFNCQGPMDAPIFVGSGMVSRKISYSISDVPSSSASEAMLKNKEAGAVAAFDRVPFSYLSANFTFSTDNCVADLYGIRASLVDGGEIRGAGNAWICPEGEEDDTAVDVNFSGNLSFDKVMQRYTELSSSYAARDRGFKWGNKTFWITFETEYWLNRKEFSENITVPFTVEGVELDLRMRGFEFFSLVSSYTFDSPRPTHLKATGKIKFHGKVLMPSIISDENIGPKVEGQSEKMTDNIRKKSLVGDLSISGLRLNQLMLAPQLGGQLSISQDFVKLDAIGRPDESLAVEVVQPLQPGSDKNLQNGKLFSFSLQKGQLKANVCLRPLHSATFEIRHLPLDELELASLRGTIQRAEIQLNFQKRRGHGVLSVLRPKFSGVLGEALDVAARWSGDVITLEKAVLKQNSSCYELQGEYVLPGGRDRNFSEIGTDGLFKRAMTGHLGSVISSMGRWRMRLEVPRAEVAEMLPLARLLSRSIDPAARSRLKDLFIQSLPSVGVYTECLPDLLEVIRGHYTASNEVVLEDLSLPGLAELKGRWHGSLDASGGGNGDTMAEFDFNGEDWEWGSYNTQCVEAVGAYNNDDGLRLEKFFIQKNDATIHADGTLLGPKTNLHFAVLNFPVSLVPTLVQIIESSATEAIHSLRQLLTPIKGILYTEGDLRGSLAKPECDVQVRLLDGTIGGIDLGRAEGSVPVTFVQNSVSDEVGIETEKKGKSFVPGWVKERSMELTDKTSERKTFRERTEESWDSQLAESLKALSPYADWLNGNADVMLQVRGTVEQPVLDGSASFHRASISSPVLRQPLTNIGNLPLRTSEASLGDKIDLKCEVLEVRAKNILSGQVDTQLQITGSILQPNISGNIKLSHGEAYLPHDKGSGAAAFNRLASNQSRLLGAGVNKAVASRYVSRFFSSEPASSRTKLPQPLVKSTEVEQEMEQVNIKPSVDVRLSDLKLVLGPELRIVYPLILNFSVSGELELNGLAHPKWIKPKGILTFENGDVNLVATQVRLKREHLNIAKFEPEHGLDPLLDLALVGSEWQFRIQSRASNWQDKLVVTSTRSVEQDVLSPTEAARVLRVNWPSPYWKAMANLHLKSLQPQHLKPDAKNRRERRVWSGQVEACVCPTNPRFAVR